MDLDLNTFFYDTAVPVANDIITKAMAGDITTIALLGIGVIVCFVIVILLVELASWILGIVKRFFLFLIVAGSTTLFFFSFKDKIFVENPDLILVISGIAGIVFALIALSISLLSIKRQWRKSRTEKISDIKSEMKKIVAEEFEDEFLEKGEKEARPEIAATQVQSPQMLTKQALSSSSILASFHDRSLLAVLSYMVVAEFGVISGVTISAPSETVGLIFFAMFLIAAMIFIKSTYHDYLKGIKHLFIALILGLTLSIVLSHVWLSVPLELLFSLDYFKTNALVALVTGLAVSLFMGSKG